MTHKIQIDDLVRDATDKEAAALIQLQNDADNEALALEAASKAKQSARLKLKTLGLTDAEIAALVG